MEIQVNRLTYQMLVSVSRYDQDGTPTTIVCPFCGEDAEVHPDGRVQCPGDWLRLVADTAKANYEDLWVSLDEASGRVLPQWLQEPPPGA